MFMNTASSIRSSVLYGFGDRSNQPLDWLRVVPRCAHMRAQSVRVFNVRDHKNAEDANSAVSFDSIASTNSH